MMNFGAFTFDKEYENWSKSSLRLYPYENNPRRRSLSTFPIYTVRKSRQNAQGRYRIGVSSLALIFRPLVRLKR